MFNSKEPLTAKMIHEDFATVAERSLQVPAGIIQKTSDKFNGLQNAGFYQSKTTKTLMDDLHTSSMSMEEKDQMRYFKVRYPFNKFITKQMALSLCRKYNLLFGSVNKYIGEIPDKNIAEIINFKLHEEDYDSIENQWVNNSSFGSGKKVWGHYHRQPGFPTYVNERPENEKEYRWKDAFNICAPLNDFNMKGMQIQADGITIEAVVKDPIVLQPVKLGYLIVSAWGDEASDKDVVNEINN